MAGPGAAGPRALRPTADRVRESLFNVLVNGVEGDRVTGTRVLDLFAGTGALGIEALSRGAQSATFVERDRAARSLIAENLRRAGAEAKILPLDATRLGPSSQGAATLIFIDPPYGRDLGPRAITAAVDGGWIAQGATIVWEESAEVAAPLGFAVDDRRRYGDTRVTFLRAAGPPGTA